MARRVPTVAAQSRMPREPRRPPGASLALACPYCERTVVEFYDSPLGGRIMPWGGAKGTCQSHMFATDVVHEVVCRKRCQPTKTYVERQVKAAYLAARLLGRTRLYIGRDC